MKKILCIALIGLQLNALAQINKSEIENILKLPAKQKINETIIQIAESFLGLPYEGGTLEGPEEKLICRIDAFDCYTFVENVLALSLVKQSSKKTYNNYLQQLQALRYRQGKINGYPSRIHYFSEWVKIAEHRGILQDLTPAVGTKIDKEINFMSVNRKLYPSFATNDEIYNEIVKMENNLSRYKFYQIKKEVFKTYQPMIRNGDIIAFTSKNLGLDVNHEGIAIWKGNNLYFMHASAERKKIVISEEPILNYLNRIKKHDGVMILRVNEPKK